MMGRVTFVAGIASLLIATSAQAEQISTLKVGNWNGGAYTHTETGEFSHCAASASYKSGITLIFSIDRGLSWALGLSDDDWKLSEGDNYPVRYWVDRGGELTGTATAITTSQVKIPLPGDDRLFARVRRGKLLTVVASNKTMKFGLTSTNRMLSALFKCTKYWREQDLTPDENPFADEKDDANPFSSDDSDNPFSSKPKPVKPKPIEPKPTSSGPGREAAASQGPLHKAVLSVKAFRIQSDADDRR